MDDRTQVGRTQDTGATGLLGSVAARPWAWLAGGLLVLLVVRLVALALNRTDLYYDEAQYWAWAQVPAFGYYSKPPLIAWLIAAATAICGNGEACVRAPSPLIHTGTALAVAVLGARLYDRTTGVLAGLAFALIPGVSLSAGIISTDVPLLACWAVALIGFAALFETDDWWPALVLGAALGVGLNAKYAMAWFVLCAGVYLVVTPARRGVLRDKRLWVALGLGVALIFPNVLWNKAHAFATLSHTADNAKWSGGLFHPLKALEFLAGQFGVFGPFYFAGLMLIAWRARTAKLAEADRFLLAFCLPLIAIIGVQALLSRAHANWAAMAYVSGVVVVIATLVREADRRWLAASFGLHEALVVGLIAATSTAGLYKAPFKGDPLTRTMGWHALSDAVREEVARARAAGAPYAAVLTDKRAVTAELIYYMRGEATPVVAFRAGDKPRDHFEMSRPFTGGTGEPVLLVSLNGAVDEGGEAGVPQVAGAFGAAEKMGERDVSTGTGATRHVTFLRLSAYKGR